MSKNPHKGTNFYDYLKEEGIYRETHILMQEKYGDLMEKDKTNVFKKIWRSLNSITLSILGFFIN